MESGVAATAWTTAARRIACLWLSVRLLQALIAETAWYPGFDEAVRIDQELGMHMQALGLVRHAPGRLPFGVADWPKSGPMPVNIHVLSI